VPRVSEFFGITISMYYDDHNPPHFHAIYRGAEAEVGIDPIGIIQGKLPVRALSLVLEWAALHQAELRSNWLRASEHRPLSKISPLE